MTHGCNRGYSSVPRELRKVAMELFKIHEIYESMK
jgi:hypothetical protein